MNVWGMARGFNLVSSIEGLVIPWEMHKVAFSRFAQIQKAEFFVVTLSDANLILVDGDTVCRWGG